MKTLIMTCATGYSWEQIRIFFESLTHVGYKGGVLVLLRNPEALLVERLKDFGADYWVVQKHMDRLPRCDTYPHFLWEKLRFLCNHYGWIGARLPAKLRIGLYARLIPWFHHISSSRYAYYYQYLAKHRHKYSHVLMSDCRDVVFQADPFEHYRDDELILSFESQSVKLRDSKHNKEWILDLYGEAVLDAIGDCPISCSGVTLGKTKGIIRYVHSLNEELAKTNRYVKARHGYDQGVHNHLIHNGKLGWATCFEYYHGPVLNMGLNNWGDLQNLHYGKIKNEKEHLVPVLHQYDRFPILKNEIDSLI